MKPMFVSTIGPTSLIQCLWESLCLSILKQYLVNRNLLSESKVFDVALHHIFLVALARICQGICHVWYDVFHKRRKVTRSNLNFHTLKLMSSDKRKFSKIVSFCTADFKLKIPFFVFKQSRVEWRNIFALAELINELSVLACYVCWVVACLTVFISETNASERIFLLVNFHLDQVPKLNQVDIRCSLAPLNNGPENCRWNLRNELSIAERLEVTTVLENRSWVG
jgi:hypothetical protein